MVLGVTNPHVPWAPHQCANTCQHGQHYGDRIGLAVLGSDARKLASEPALCGLGEHRPGANSRFVVDGLLRHSSAVGGSSPLSVGHGPNFDTVDVFGSPILRGGHVDLPGAAMRASNPSERHRAQHVSAALSPAGSASANTV